VATHAQVMNESMAKGMKVQLLPQNEILNLCAFQPMEELRFDVDGFGKKIRSRMRDLGWWDTAVAFHTACCFSVVNETVGCKFGALTAFHIAWVEHRAATQ
jgi:hypothetical protein